MGKSNVGALVLDQQQIREGVIAVARKLNDRFQEAVMITVVPGGIFFAADLARELTFSLGMDYISCPHTPGDNNNTSPIVYHQNIDISGKDVIVVDDAIESGGTMSRVIHDLATHYRPYSLSISTLLVKPGRVDIPVPQYFAYEMPNDDLLVGYGLPWHDRLRNVPFISKLEK